MTLEEYYKEIELFRSMLQQDETFKTREDEDNA
jgi:hypothetical protein